MECTEIIAVQVEAYKSSTVQKTTHCVSDQSSKRASITVRPYRDYTPTDSFMVELDLITEDEARELGHFYSKWDMENQLPNYWAQMEAPDCVFLPWLPTPKEVAINQEYRALREVYDNSHQSVLDYRKMLMWILLVERNDQTTVDMIADQITNSYTLDADLPDLPDLEDEDYVIPVRKKTHTCDGKKIHRARQPRSK